MNPIQTWLAGCVLATGVLTAPSVAQTPSALQAGQTGQDAATAEAARQQTALSEAISLGARWIETQRRYARIPAISVAVARGDQTVWSRGFGTIDRKGRVPASGDTLYAICSISKLFTAAAVMQQWEQGRLRLDEPITTYLPWARLAPDARESVPITLRGLLTHSAGLPRESAHPYWTGPDFPFPTAEEIRASISGQAPLYPASTTFQYSNLGLTLAGDAVEAVTGTAYGDYVTTNILAPLGLAHTRPLVPADRYGKDLAVGWGALTAEGDRPEVKLFAPKGITPAAGFTSSVNDLAKFASWQFRLLRSGEPEVLRASTLREMQRVHYITPDRETSWGLGFATYEIDGRTLVGHGGSCPGYRSMLMIDPASETAVAVAMNAMDDPGLYARGLYKLLTIRLTAEVYAAPDTGAVDLGQFTGIYGGQPWGPDSAILPWAGGLVWAELATGDPIGDMTRLKPLGGDRFRIMTARGEERDVVTFRRDGSGAVSAVERFGNISPRLRAFPSMEKGS